MRTSCIAHPPQQPLIIIHAWQRKFCEGNVTAAALLSFFEYWHNIKLDMQQKAIELNRVSERHGEVGAQDTTLWQHHTNDELIDGIQGIGKKDAVRDAVAYLEGIGAIEVGSNPVARYRFDRTRFYRFHPEVVNAWLAANYPLAENRISNDGKSPMGDSGANSAPPIGGKPSMELRETVIATAENRRAITEITSMTTLETTEEKGNDAQEASAPEGAPLLPAEPILEEEGENWQSFLEELSAICYGHKQVAILTKKEMGALCAEGRKIRAAGFGIDDLRLWMTDHWFKDWRWQKGQQRPKPSEVRSGIPQIDVREGAGGGKKYSQYNNF